MSFVTDGQLLAMVADRLKVRPADLPAYWADSITPQANESAYQEVLGRLLDRGFTKTQIDQWDRGAEFQQAIGLYLALVNGGAYAGYDAGVLQMLDRRKELKEVLVFISGEWVKPVGDRPGLVTTAGPNTAGGTFNWPDPDGPGVGDYTRW